MLGQEILDISQPQKGFFVYEITPVSFKDLLAGVENTSFMWDNRDILWVSMLVSERMVRNGWSERVPRGEGSERVCKVVLPSASFPKSYQKHIWKKCEMRNGNNSNSTSRDMGVCSLSALQSAYKSAPKTALRGEKTSPCNLDLTNKKKDGESVQRRMAAMCNMHIGMYGIYHMCIFHKNLDACLLLIMNFHWSSTWRDIFHNISFKIII